jgi:hypothetical protein
MDSLPVIIIGIVGLVSIGWQVILIERDQGGDFPKRVASGLIVSAIIIIGVTFYSSYRLFFDSAVKDYSVLSAAKGIGLAVVFGFLFTVKSYFGPLVLGYVAGYSVYMFFEHDVLVVAPVVKWLLGLLFSNMPQWLGMAYTVVLSLYLIVVSGLDLDQ